MIIYLISKNFNTRIVHAVMHENIIYTGNDNGVEKINWLPFLTYNNGILEEVPIGDILEEQVLLFNINEIILPKPLNEIEGDYKTAISIAIDKHILKNLGV